MKQEMLGFRKVSSDEYLYFPYSEYRSYAIRLPKSVARKMWRRHNIFMRISGGAGILTVLCASLLDANELYGIYVALFLSGLVRAIIKDKFDLKGFPVERPQRTTLGEVLDTEGGRIKLDEILIVYLVSIGLFVVAGFAFTEWKDNGAGGGFFFRSAIFFSCAVNICGWVAGDLFKS